jgi:hypothetical protein
MPYKQALDALVIIIFIENLKVSLLNVLVLCITTKFIARFAFIKRFKGIMDKLS